MNAFPLFEGIHSNKEYVSENTLLSYYVYMYVCICFLLLNVCITTGSPQKASFLSSN